MSDSKLALYLAAEKYRLGRNLDKAIAKYREILLIEPFDLGILKKLAGLYEKQEKSDEAVETYQAMARVMIQREQKEEAATILKYTQSLDPENEKTAMLLTELTGDDAADEVVADEEVPSIQELDTPPVKLETPLFKDLNDEQLESIIKVIKPLKLKSGTTVFSEGDQSDSLFIIEEGSFEVRTQIRQPGTDDKEAVFSVLERGQFFGEFAFLTGSPRVASVSAKEDSVIYQLTKSDLDNIIAKHPAVEDRLFLFYKSRALDLVLAKSPLFYTIPPEERRVLLEGFFLNKYKAEDPIIREGTKDDNLFLIKKGEIRVQTTDPHGDKIVLGSLTQHQFFGEISFLTGMPRTADVIANTDCEVMIISGEDLARIIDKYPNIEKVLRDFHENRALSTLEKLTSTD